MKVGLVQMNITADIGRNTQAVLEAIERAESEGVRFLAFPEGALSGYGLDRRSLRRVLRNPDRIRKALRTVERQVKAGTSDVLLPSAWRERGRWRMRAFHLRAGRGRDGHYDKMVLTPEEEGTVTPGRRLGIFGSARRRIGVLLCSDFNGDELPALLAFRGALCLFVLSYPDRLSLIRDVDREFIQLFQGRRIIRAFNNRCFIVTVFPAGREARSAVVDPLGKVVLEAASDAEDLLVADINLEEAGEARDETWNRRKSLFSRLAKR